jgi:hypothetical protein
MSTFSVADSTGSSRQDQTPHVLAAALALSYLTLLISSFAQGYLLVEQNGHGIANETDPSAAGAKQSS